MRHVAAVTVASVLWGCVTVETRHYEPQRAVMQQPLPPYALLDAAARNAAAQGWTVVLMDRAHGRMEALTPVDKGEGVVTRERWTFWVVDQELKVAMTLEVKEDSGNRWQSTQELCEGYGYLRESDQLSRVVAVAQLETQKQMARATTPNAPQ